MLKSSISEIDSRNPISTICQPHPRIDVFKGINFTSVHQHEADEFSVEVLPKTSHKLPVLKKPQNKGPPVLSPSQDHAGAFPFPLFPPHKHASVLYFKEHTPSDLQPGRKANNGSSQTNPLTLSPVLAPLSLTLCD